jgi:hypothetical protein
LINIQKVGSTENTFEGTWIINYSYWIWFTFSVSVMVFNVNFNSISVILWRSVLLVEETGVSGENNRPAVSNWQTLSHNVVSSIPRMSGIRTNNVSANLITIKSWPRRYLKPKLKVTNYIRTESYIRGPMYPEENYLETFKIRNNT